MLRLKNANILIVLAMITILVIGGCGKKTQNTPQNENQSSQGMTSNPQETTGVAQNIPPAQAEQKAVIPETPRHEKPRPERTKPVEVTLTVPMSTPISVTLTDSIQTNVNQSGDHVSGVMANAVIVDGKTVIPAGANVDILVAKIVKGGTLKTPPEIAFQVDEVTLADGTQMQVSTDQISDKGRSHTKREVGMIGGGAAAGGVIGGLLGKGKGAAIGAAAGAVAGTGAAAATGRQNLVYPSGQTVNFTLNQPLTVTVSQK